MTILDVKQISEQLDALSLDDLKPIEDVLRRKHLMQLRLVTRQARAAWSPVASEEINYLVDEAVAHTRAAMKDEHQGPA